MPETWHQILTSFHILSTDYILIRYDAAIIQAIDVIRRHLIGGFPDRFIVARGVRIDWWVVVWRAALDITVNHACSKNISVQIVLPFSLLHSRLRLHFSRLLLHVLVSFGSYIWVDSLIFNILKTRFIIRICNIVNVFFLIRGKWWTRPLILVTFQILVIAFWLNTKSRIFPNIVEHHHYFSGIFINSITFFRDLLIDWV